MRLLFDEQLSDALPALLADIFPGCPYWKLETPCLHCTSVGWPVSLPASMIAVIVALFGALRSTCRPQAELVAENLALRHQLAVLRRQAPVRLRLRRLDRVVWVVLSRGWSGWRQAVQIVSPDTVVR